MTSAWLTLTFLLSCPQSKWLALSPMTAMCGCRRQVAKTVDFLFFLDNSSHEHLFSFFYADAKGSKQLLLRADSTE
jgi:hypothetical protein